MRVLKLVIACVALANSAVADAAKPGILLVHGAFANASGWSRVIAILQHDGYQVMGVENPLHTLQGDIATTRRAMDSFTGPVILVGHSYGGVVISGAAAGDAKVKALVYIAAIAPNAGERVNEYFGKFPAEANSAVKRDSAGFLTVDRNRFAELFAGDLPPAEGAILGATQKPIREASFAAVMQQAPAWKTIPSWYVVAKRDRALNPDLERFYARRMGARTTELDASHFLFLSRPREIAQVIEQAAASVGK